LRQDVFREPLIKAGLSFPRKRESMFLKMKWFPAFAGKTLIQRFLRAYTIQYDRSINCHSQSFDHAQDKPREESVKSNEKQIPRPMASE
jgi:hypothetical protein